MNRLKTVTDATGTTSYSYDAVGNRSEVVYPNQTRQRYTYNSLNRLTGLSTLNAAGQVVQSYAYTLDATGRRTQITEASGRTSAYSYDHLYRLTSENITDVTAGNHSSSYQYDKVGNRVYQTVNGVQTAYTYDDNDRLLTAGGVIYTYDAQGNTLSQTDENGQLATYHYNSRQQLVGHTINGQTTHYAYNTEGNRTQQGNATQSTAYLIDQNRDYAQVVAEYDSTGLKKSYSYGDDLISQTESTSTHYYHYDGLGSTRALSDTSGALTDTYAYDAFGDVLSQTGTTDNTYRFTGEQYDAGLDQYYLRARYYDQGVGRFTQQDSWMGKSSDPITLHKYLYANSDSVNHLDPSGHMSLGGMMTSMNVQTSLNMTAGIATRQIFSRTFVGAALRYGLLAIKKEIKTCLKEAITNSARSKCRIDIPIVVAANDFPTQFAHIQDAQEGNGNNFSGQRLPSVLRYQRTKINRETWPQDRITGGQSTSPNGIYGCTQNDSDIAIQFYKVDLDCDEYPFSISIEGGFYNFKQGRVSARFIPDFDNRGFGGLLGVLGKMRKGEYYIVAPLEMAPKSMIINKPR